MQRVQMVGMNLLCSEQNGADNAPSQLGMQGYRFAIDRRDGEAATANFTCLKWSNRPSRVVGIGGRIQVSMAGHQEH